MGRHEIPLLTQHDRLRAKLVVIEHEHRAIEPRGFDSRNRRERLHREWDETYDELMAVRLAAYLAGVELPPLFPTTDSPAFESA